MGKPTVSMRRSAAQACNDDEGVRPPHAAQTIRVDPNVRALTAEPHMDHISVSLDLERGNLATQISELIRREIQALGLHSNVMTTVQAAKYIGVSRQTLEQQRHRGTGPPTPNLDAPSGTAART